MKGIKNNSVKVNIRGSVSVSEGSRYGQKQIASNSNFFKTERVIVKVFENENCVKFIRATIDYNGKTYKPQEQNDYFHFQILAEIPLGKFEFDADESDEDVVTIYYPDN